MSEKKYDNYEIEEKHEAEGKLPRLQFLPTLGIGIGILIVLELLFQMLLDPRVNPAHAYLAYMMGILVFGIMGFLNRSKAKVSAASLIVILVSFIPPFILPNQFYGLFSVFQSTVDNIRVALDRVSSIDPNFTNPIAGTQLELIFVYSFIFDLIFALFIGIPIAFILTWVAQILTTKPGIKTLISLPFVIVLFLIFIIVIPFTLVTVAGFAQFGSNLGVGGLYLSEAMATFGNSDATNFDQAFPYLDNATEFFGAAETNFRGIEQLGLFWLIKTANPDYGLIVDNGVPLVKSLLELAQALAPFGKGAFTMGKALELAFTALGIGTSSLALMLAQANSTIDEAKFEQGLNLLDVAQGNITIAIEQVKEAIKEAKKINFNELQQSMEQNMGDASTVNLLEDGVFLSDQILDVFGVFLDPTVTGTNRSALEELLLGTKALKEAENKLGGSSLFNGTTPLFQAIVDHISPVLTALDNEKVNSFLNATPPQTDELKSFKDNADSGIKFIKDAGNVTIAFGNFGLTMAPIYEIGTGVLDAFQGNLTAAGDDVLALPLTLFDNTWIPELTVMYLNASQLETTATVLDTGLSAMRATAANSEYGLFSEPAKEFASVLGGINYTQEVENIKALSGKLLSIMHAIRWLIVANTRYTDLQNSFNNATTDGNVNSSEATAMLGLTTQLDEAINMTQWAVNNAIANQTNSLEQATSLDQSLSVVSTQLDTKIIPGITTIKDQLNGPLANIDTNAISNALSDIQDGLQTSLVALASVKL